MLGNFQDFSMSADFFCKINIFKELFSGISSLHQSVQQFGLGSAFDIVGLDLGPNCLQRFLQSTLAGKEFRIILYTICSKRP